MLARRALPIAPELAERPARVAEWALRRYGHGSWLRAILIGTAAWIMWFFRELDLAIPPCDNARWDCDGMTVTARILLSRAAFMLAIAFAFLAVAARRARRGDARWRRRLAEETSTLPSSSRDPFVATWTSPESVLVRLSRIIHVIAAARLYCLALGIPLLAFALNLVQERARSGIIIDWNYVLLLVVPVGIFLATRKYNRRVLIAKERLLEECRLERRRLEDPGKTVDPGAGFTFRPWHLRPTSAPALEKA